MVKSRAEIQRDYRERKKRIEGESYKKRERERRQKYYVKTSELSTPELKKRREQTLNRVKKHYAKKRKSASEKLELKFPFQGNHASGVRKRQKTALRSAYRQIEELKNENNQLKRRNKTIQKRLERERTNKGDHGDEENSPVTTASASGEPTTPRSRTKQFLQNYNFNGKQRKMVRKKLLFANIMLEEVKKNIENRKNQRSSKRRIASGEIIKKCKMLKYVGDMAGVNRK